MSWLAVLLLLLSAQSVHADDPQAALSISTITNPNADQLQSVTTETSRKDFIDFVTNATLSAAYSGCSLCQQTGQCDHAYHGQPGQFCIGMASGAPCCCPQGAQCAATPYECRCRRAVPYPHGGSPDNNHHQPKSSSGGVFSTILFIAILLLCCVCCCYLPARRAQQEREEQYAYAQPVASSQYGTYADQQPQAPYTYASAPVAYEATPYRESGGGSGHTMAAGALGALGGLGVGAALGSAFGGHNNNDAGYTGYSGDVGGVSDNTYTFSGDTGGGEFEGDGGDDGSFAGDS